MWNLSSNQAQSLRTSKRPSTSRGMSGGAGTVSSIYSQIAWLSERTLVSIRSTGTLPAGLRRRKSGEGSQKRSSTSSTSIFFSASVSRTLRQKGDSGT